MSAPEISLDEKVDNMLDEKDGEGPSYLDGIMEIIQESLSQNVTAKENVRRLIKSRAQSGEEIDKVIKIVSAKIIAIAATPENDVIAKLETNKVTVEDLDEIETPTSTPEPEIYSRTSSHSSYNSLSSSNL